MGFNKPPIVSRHYLLEADPYYYYYLTQKVNEIGKLGSVVKHDKFFNPNRVAPKGVWSFVTWHPYGGYYLFRFLRMLKPQCDMMSVLCYYPLILMMVVVLCFFTVCVALKKGIFASFLGCVTLVLSPVAIQRGAFGWYDTDPYNYIFPLLILSSLIVGCHEKKRALVFGIAGGILTAVYSFFWVGWPFIVCLIVLGGVSASMMSHFFKMRGPEYALKYTLFYILSALLGLLCFMTPIGLYQSLLSVWKDLPMFTNPKYDVWPNIFITVGETRSISFQKLIFLTGNYLSYGMAAFGVIGAGVFYIIKKSSQDFSQWLVLVIVSVPLFILPFHTERFSLLFVMPLSVFTVFGAELMRDMLQTLMAKVPFVKAVVTRWLSMLVIILWIIPAQLVFAHGVVMGLHPIMDDAWYDTLQQIRQKTPEDSIVYSWWPPGHFITSVARRRVLVDGASQHLPECYWIARFFVATEENEALGILRMLRAGGNDALDYLLREGYDFDDAMSMIIRVIKLDRDEAAKNMAEVEPVLPETIREKLLPLTHGQTTPGPSYIMLYYEMIEKSMGISYIGKWNFRKAKTQREKQQTKGMWERLTSGKEGYIQNLT
ncbi:MAG: STT3 domain-containing protein, partial [Candidatus Omnitrophica bacterium]|nr:STT3 domain-containing protein [Candidatus Omnitrophota bacterium]